MYIIQATDQFLRQARKFFKKHQDLKVRFEKLVTELAKDPFKPALELHPRVEDLMASGCKAYLQVSDYPDTDDYGKEIILLI